MSDKENSTEMTDVRMLANRLNDYCMLMLNIDCS